DDVGRPRQLDAQTRLRAGRRARPARSARLGQPSRSPRRRASDGAVKARRAFAYGLAAVVLLGAGAVAGAALGTKGAADPGKVAISSALAQIAADESAASGFDGTAATAGDESAAAQTASAAAVARAKAAAKIEQRDSNAAKRYAALATKLIHAHHYKPAEA